MRDITRQAHPNEGWPFTSANEANRERILAYKADETVEERLDRQIERLY